MTDFVIEKMSPYEYYNEKLKDNGPVTEDNTEAADEEQQPEKQKVKTTPSKTKIKSK